MSRIFITGDTHGEVDMSKLNSKKFPQGKNLTRDDYVIICGDFGGIWDGSNTDKYVLNWYNKKPWTTLFVDGNHENFSLLKQYPVTEWNGGRVHKISDSIYHLMRGQVFVLNGKKFFTFGGASSIDRQFREEHINWWREELPNQFECRKAMETLEANNYSVDYVITHCLPMDIVKLFFGEYARQDTATKFLQEVYETVDYKKWFCGHYHTDLEIIDLRIQMLYQNIIELS